MTFPLFPHQTSPRWGIKMLLRNMDFREKKATAASGSYQQHLNCFQEGRAKGTGSVPKQERDKSSKTVPDCLCVCSGALSRARFTSTVLARGTQGSSRERPKTGRHLQTPPRPFNWRDWPVSPAPSFHPVVERTTRCLSAAASHEQQ